ncbi:hypothetical protein A6D98_09815 [Aliivibrio fischeri]|uniref:Uncharacterized protein n=1 Tax=Aliivibrio phage vB_Alvi_H905 TaxID=3234039 RepID=A0AB39C9N0_9VIRU|nr:hypothetical protein [Aliivibrio fischeri]OCH08125.1 hypothetical protein A6E09_17400 [Aliivibrio fischeri]OCH60887.1 hypothetical protein A6D98_09815 [Aliivibrio fischeri]
MSNSEIVATIAIQGPKDLRTAQRQQLCSLNKTQAFLIGAGCTLEKALENTDMDDEARRLVNSAFFQLQQVENECEKLHAHIDALTLIGKSHE